jgi:hypothetical protein
MLFYFQSTRRSGLAALFSILLSVSNIANAGEIIHDHWLEDEKGKALYLPNGKPYLVTVEQLDQDDYEAYLKQYYPQTDHYVLYTGGSAKQADAL